MASDRTLAAALLASLVLHVAMLAGYLRPAATHPVAQVRSFDRLIVNLQQSARDAGTFGSAPPAPAPAPAPASARPPAPASAAGDRPQIQQPDLEAAREIARRLARTGSRGQDAAGGNVLAMETETPLGRAIAQSYRGDCRQAYAGYGLLALPLLARDAVLDKGCNW